MASRAIIAVATHLKRWLAGKRPSRAVAAAGEQVVESIVVVTEEG